MYAYLSEVLQSYTEKPARPLQARVAHLRVTDEGERRLADAFTSNEQERDELRMAIEHLDASLV